MDDFSLNPSGANEEPLLVVAAPALAAGDPLPREAPPRRSACFRFINGLSAPRLVVLLHVVVSVPQIIAAAVILPLEPYTGGSVCSGADHARWRWWAAISAVRMCFATVVVLKRRRLELASDMPRRARLARITSLNTMRNALDAVNLIWFVIGNMWLFGNARPGHATCTAFGHSATFTLCVVMLGTQYLQICLPCIAALITIPVFCFCLPCVIRMLALLQDPMRGKGASPATIAKLPTAEWTGDEESGDGASPVPGAEFERSCSVCLSNFDKGETIRVLPCKHYFHASCVDQWLGVNASCPNCRTSIFEHDDEEGDEAGAPLRESYGESVESETGEVRASERAAEGDDRGLSTASAAALV